MKEYVAAKLEPYRITGERWGWFDYLCRIEGRQPFSDSDTERRIPNRVRAALRGYICDIGKAQDAEQPLVLVTLDGEWHGGEVSYDAYRHRERSEFEEAVRIAHETWQYRYGECPAGKSTVLGASYMGTFVGCGHSLTKQWSRRGETSALSLCRITPRGSLLSFGFMKVLVRSSFLAILFIALVGCGQPALDPAHTGKMWIADPAEHEQMIAALSNARIHSEVHEAAENRKEIWYDTRFQEQVLRIRDDLFGAAPPNGRNMALKPDDAAVFAEEMRKLGAAFRTGKFHGGKYVAWDAESDGAADSVLEKLSISPETIAENKRIRELVDAEPEDRTNRSSRSREERAPAER